MAQIWTVADLQTDLAYRLGETAAPSDSTTKTVRLSWLNKAYFDISRRQNWWWQEQTDTSNTNTASATGYTEPSDLKEYIELVISNVFYTRIPYKDRRIYQNALGVVVLPTLRRNFLFYTFNGKYYIIPTDGGDGATHTIKYYRRVTKLVNDSDTLLIPDEYAEALVAYAEGRYWMSITQQAKSVAPFTEYEQIVTEMAAEHTRRGYGSTGYRIKDIDDAF